MDVSEVCRQLLSALGGKENITSNEACMTRLRVGIRDLSLVDIETIKSIEASSASYRLARCRLSSVPARSTRSSRHSSA